MNHFETQVNQAIDTIAAVATPHGRGGIAVIRISGPSVQTIGKDLLGHLPKTRYAEYLSFLAADRTTIVLTFTFKRLILLLERMF